MVGESDETQENRAVLDLMPIDKKERTTKYAKSAKRISLSCVSSVSWFSTKFLGEDFGGRAGLYPRSQRREDGFAAW